MRKTYVIQIGNMNGQHTYKVDADSVAEAKESALNFHKNLGRSKESDNVYVISSLTRSAK